MDKRFNPNRPSKTISHSHFPQEMWDALPDRVKNYIADQEQSGAYSEEIQQIASLTEQRDALVEKVKELQQVIDLQGNEDQLRELVSEMAKTIQSLSDDKWLTSLVGSKFDTLSIEFIIEELRAYNEGFRFKTIISNDE